MSAEDKKNNALACMLTLDNRPKHRAETFPVRAKRVKDEPEKKIAIRH